MIGLPWWFSSKESTSDAEVAGDTGLIPGSGRPAGGGHGNPCQYSCLENPNDRGAWWATVHGAEKSWTQLMRPTHRATVGYLSCGGVGGGAPGIQGRWVRDAPQPPAVHKTALLSSPAVCWPSADHFRFLLTIPPMRWSIYPHFSDKMLTCFKWYLYGFSTAGLLLSLCHE